MDESVAQIGTVVDALIERSDEIAYCAQDSGCRVCNLFMPREARKTIQLRLDFIVAIAQASSMSAVAVVQPALAELADHLQAANAAVTARLPRDSRSLITCLAAGEQFVLNLLLRGDPAAQALAKIAHHLTLPLKQILLICFQKLHDQLTVGC